MWSYKKGGSRSLENVRHPWCCEKRIALQDSKDLFWIRTGILPYLYSPMCRTFCTFQQTCQTNWTFNIWTKTYCISYIYIHILFRERGNIKRVANMEKNSILSFKKIITPIHLLAELQLFRLDLPCQKAWLEIIQHPNLNRWSSKRTLRQKTHFRVQI